MGKSKGLQLFYALKKETIDAKAGITLPDAKSGTMAMDFMTETYQINHIDLIEFMRKSTIQKMMLSKVPQDGRGYVKVYVKKTGKTFTTYGEEFEPYHIIHKYWGLGYQNVDINDFVFFECLYENDFTKFRGCFKK